MDSSSDTIENWWSDHWKARKGLTEHQFDTPVWETIKDIVQTPGTLLEAGCGVPNWVKHFDKLGFDAIGVDFAPTGLLIGLKDEPNLKLMRSDFRQLAVSDNSMDYILSLGAIEHDKAGPDKALKEFHRTLKSDGYLMCSVPCLNIKRQLGLPLLVARDQLKRTKILRKLWNKTEPFEFYQYVWSPATYRKILAKAGFELIEMRGYGYKENPSVIESSMTKIYNLYGPHMMMAICKKIR